MGIMALLIAIELFTLWFSLTTLSSVRAFVGGEGLWSKAEKDAVYNLQKYSYTHNEQDYLDFKKFMKIPLGDHKTLLELIKKDPDFEIAREGFIEGRNHPNDINGMIKLFKRFHKISYINKAINIWVKADSTIFKLMAISEKLHEEINLKPFSEEKISRINSEIGVINNKLTLLEDNFSYTLGEGARWLENLILTILFLIALTVELSGLFLTISVSMGITKGINEITRIAKKIATADFSDKAKVYSEDEIGQLAGSFNEMIYNLQSTINKRTQAEEVIRQQQELYESLIKTQSEMGQGIAITENKKIIYANDALYKMYGYSKEEIFQMPSFIDMVIPEDKERLSDKLKKRLSGADMADIGETAIIRKDGKIINIEYSVKMINIQGRVQTLSVIRDITARKQAETELKQKAEELIRSNKELEQFAYVASHDLQEPLRMVTAYVQLLEERYKNKLGADANEFIAFALNGTERMRSLIFSLLEYSRINRVKPFEIIDMCSLIDDVLHNLNGLVKENNAVIKINGKPPDIYGDNILIGQLFQNLISNSIKFKGKQPPEIIISGEKLNKEYLFSIKDNGIGIKKEYAEKIFVIFQRLHTKEEYPGTGIGLAICKKIVERHGGKIWMESEVGKGSDFYFTIKENGKTL